MPFDRPSQSLQGIEGKLRKLWNLAGVIGATFKPEITPSINIGNLDDPGVATFQGRHWALISDAHAGTAANLCYGFTSAVDIIVRGVFSCSNINAAAGALVPVYQLTPDMTVPAALSRTPVGAWVDQRASLTDVPPFTDTGAAWAAVAGGPGAAMRVSACRVAILRGQASIGPDMFDWRDGLHLPRGNSLFYDTNVPAGSTVTYVGAWGIIA